MLNAGLDENFPKPILWFGIGWCLVLLVPILPLAPSLQTFIHPWRPELTASVVFLATLSYLLYRNWNRSLQLSFSRIETNLIILPLLAFIVWSGLSVFWSPSPGSALYHTLVWAEYLIFYVIVRHIFNTRNGFKAVLAPLVATLLVIGLPPVFEYLSFLFFGGTTSLGMRYVKYGELFNTVTPVLAVLVLRLNGKKFLLGLAGLLTVWLFIISTLGRTNLVLFLTGMIVIGFFVFIVKHLHKYRLRISILIAAVVLVPLPYHLISLFAEEPSVPIIKRMDDSAHTSYSSDVRKLLKSVSLEMFAAHPVTGTGAGNFGRQFNDYRRIYAEKNPSDTNLITAENEIAERTHNEYLQILAELGTVGGLIFLWFLGGIAVMLFTALRRLPQISLLPSAALLGVCFFLASSMISSYSFRLVQNGFVFFFVLAIAAAFFLKEKTMENNRQRIRLDARQLKFGYALGITACLLLTVHCLARAASVYYSNKAQSQPDIQQALPYYKTALRLDGENPAPHFAYGLTLFNTQRYPESALELTRSINNQRATSVDYSYLATAQTLAGDDAEAEKTMARALVLYPFSPFVRTRYAALLKANGKTGEAAAQLQTALQYNRHEASTWWTLITEGPRKASLRAAQNKELVPVYKLTPEEAIFAVVAERDIKYPNERFTIKTGE